MPVGGTIRAAPTTVSGGYVGGSRVIGGTTVGSIGGTTYSGGVVSSGVVRPAGTTVLSAGSPYGGSTIRTVAGPGGVTYRTVGASPTYVSSRPATTVIQSGATVPTQPNYALGQYAAQAYEVKHSEDPQLKNLKDLRSSCGLKYVPVGEGLKALKGAAVDNKLSRDVFISAYASLLSTYGIEVPSDSVKNAVFDLFDRDDNGIVDMMELICGISLLCQGSEEDKIHAVFDVFDENGDGFISMDEMFKFLTSVFKVVLTPNVMGVMRSMGVEVESAEDLASVTALECFKAADLNQDGRLSITEFKEWFYAPKNDPSFLFSPMRKLLQ